MELPIVYRDDHLIAINKPHGLLVHRTSIAADVNVFAMQSLRNQIGQKVYLIHRLDRKTSGALLFALDKMTATAMNDAFRQRKVSKTYKAIVRGWVPEEHGIIDYDLTNDEGKTQNAITYYKCLKHIELPVPFGRYDTSRYSIVEAYPETGRQHQIRKHLSHIRYPIIGDRPHGCNKQNKLWKEKWNMTTMLLHAQSLAIKHPISGEKVEVSATQSLEMTRVERKILGIV